MRLTTRLTAAAAALVLATAITVPTRASTPAPAVPAMTAASVSSVLVTTPPTAQDQGVTIELKTDDGRGAWYTQPVWIAIGIIALVLLVVLISMGARRDRTTIVK